MLPQKYEDLLLRVERYAFKMVKTTLADKSIDSATFLGSVRLLLLSQATIFMTIVG
jgi:hypothetical protein